MPYPYRPLSDPEFTALAPLFARRAKPGRVLADLRGRLDAMFWMAAHPGPWRRLPRRFGAAPTASRQFRRWAAAGAWHRLLAAIALPGADPILAPLHQDAVELHLRAAALHGIEGLLLTRRLDLPQAPNEEARALRDPRMPHKLANWMCRPENALDRLPRRHVAWLGGVIETIPEWPPRPSVRPRRPPPSRATALRT